MPRKSTSFSLPPDVLTGLRDLAKAEDRSQAEILSELVRRKVAEQQLWAAAEERLADHERRISALERLPTPAPDSEERGG